LKALDLSMSGGYLASARAGDLIWLVGLRNAAAGAQAPYGYVWKDKKLELAPEEAPVRKLN
jgi:hypothetical protein